MKLGVYAIRDAAIKCFVRPFYARSDAEAVRSVSDVCKDSTHPFSQHPEDYEVYKLGEFDEETGLFAVGAPVGLVSVKSLALRCN